MSELIQGLVSNDGPMSLIGLAKAAQESYENGQFILTSILLFIVFTHVIKKYGGEKTKRNAAKISAGLGAGAGAAASSASGADPGSGAMGGLLLGNTASGLYSSFLKPILKSLKQLPYQKYLPLFLSVGVPLAKTIIARIKETPDGKKQQALKNFNDAMKKAKDKENPSTKELEKWIGENL